MLKSRIKRMSGLCMAIIMAATFALSVSAASEDVIDSSKTGSITIHKYDITAAEKEGVSVDDIISTGEKNEQAEQTLANYAIKGVEFSYVRVGNVETMSENGNVKLIYEIPSELQVIIGLDTADAAKTTGGKTYFTGQQINDAMANALLDNTSTKDKLEAYAKNGIVMDLTDANGVTSKSGLDLGLYLIIETKVPEDVTYTTNPWFIQLPMTDYTGDHWFYDVTCYPKNQTGVPTLDKKVRNNPDQENVVTASEEELSVFTDEREEYTYSDTVTATEKELLDYELISKLPHITSTSTYLTTYTFKDVLSKGITYGQDAVIAFYDTKDAADTTNKNNVNASGAIAVWTKDSGNFIQNYSTLDDGKSQMVIEMTDAGLDEINKNYSDKYIVVYYTARVNSDETVITGDKGNPNDVSLEWRRTSETYYDILKDKCIVYTFGIELTKKFSDENGDPTKVQFVLQNKTDNYFVTADGANGVYYVNGKSSAEDHATQFCPASDGTLVINGIEGDTYALTETHSDTGYSLLKEPMTVVINSSSADITPTVANVTGIQSKAEEDSTANDGIVKGTALANEVSAQTVSASAEVDGTKASMNPCKTDADSVHALVVMEVLNSKGFLLPQTGGKGVYLITILGVIIAAAGFCISSKNKKKA